jgi:hypothetical protein
MAGLTGAGLRGKGTEIEGKTDFDSRQANTQPAELSKSEPERCANVRLKV